MTWVRLENGAPLLVSRAEGRGRLDLLTEDLQAGQNLAGVLVVNPFSSEPPARWL